MKKILLAPFFLLFLGLLLNPAGTHANLDTKTEKLALVDKDDEILVYFPKRTSDLSKIFDVIWYSFGDVEYVSGRDNQMLEEASDAGRVIVVAAFKNFDDANTVLEHLQKGIKALDEFSIKGTKLKFSHKICFLSTSRAAPIHFAFALRHPERVSGLANIHPDLRIADNFKPALDFNRDIKQLVALKIPLLHMHGTKDQLNPYQQERDFVSKYLSAGGDMTLVTEWDNSHAIPTVHEYGASVLSHFLIQNSSN